MIRLQHAALALFLACAAVPARAEPNAPPPSGDGILALLPGPAKSRHTITLAGQPFSYEAQAGALPLRDGTGRVTARLFYTAYTAEPLAHARPLTFVFNGGPGAASAYLHIGAMGPRVIPPTPDGSVAAPPARLVDNPDTWLDFTDLVFVDPVGTGYSRAAGPKNDTDFYGVDADEQAMAAFIRLYLAESGRATSPVFLVGESYGGFRAVRLAKALPAESGIGPSGIVLISPALEFSFLFNHDTGEVLPDALRLPAMAAVNLLHQGVADRQELAARLEPVERFAITTYLPLLAQGPEAARKASGRIAALIGLPIDVVREHDGDVSFSEFIKEFARSDGRVLSRYDGTVSGPDTDPASPFVRGPDPILDRTVPIWTSAFADYVRGDLGYRTDVTYRLLARDVNRHWQYTNDKSDQGYAGAMDTLQEARTYNPALQVMIAQGFTDLVTPYSVSRYLVAQLPTLTGAAPITQRTYLGGHMMYLRPDSRAALKADAMALYARALGKP